MTFTAATALASPCPGCGEAGAADMFRVRQPPLRGNLMLSDRIMSVSTRFGTLFVFGDFDRSYTKEFTVVAAERCHCLLTGPF